MQCSAINKLPQIITALFNKSKTRHTALAFGDFIEFIVGKPPRSAVFPCKTFKKFFEIRNASYPLVFYNRATRITFENINIFV